MPHIEHESVTPVLMLPGIFRRTMTDGDKMMLCEVYLADGATVPMHTHLHEQTGYLVSGKITLTIGDEKKDLGPGDCWMIPGDVPHEAIAREASVLIDVFSPPREDYR